MRIQALRAIVKSYRPEVPVLWIKTELSFKDISSCIKFLEEQQIKLIKKKTLVDTKMSNMSSS